MPDLFLKSEEEFRFYYELRRRMNASIINDEDQSRGFIVGDNQVKFEEGKIILSAGNRITREIPIKEFSSTPNRTFREMMKYIRNSE